MRHERRLALHPALPLVRPRSQPARRRCGAADPRRTIVRNCVSAARPAAASVRHEMGLEDEESPSAPAKDARERHRLHRRLALGARLQVDPSALPARAASWRSDTKRPPDTARCRPHKVRTSTEENFEPHDTAMMHDARGSPGATRPSGSRPKSTDRGSLGAPGRSYRCLLAPKNACNIFGTPRDIRQPALQGARLLMTPEMWISANVFNEVIRL
jgi:hypothetical protein